MLKRLFGAGLAALAGVAFAAGASAQTLDKIKSRGVLVVGSKADYKPFGFRDPSGAIVGFEPDIGKEIADKLGGKLELEPVVSSASSTRSTTPPASTCWRARRRP